MQEEQKGGLSRLMKTQIKKMPRDQLVSSRHVPTQLFLEREKRRREAGSAGGGERERWRKMGAPVFKEG